MATALPRPRPLVNPVSVLGTAGGGKPSPTSAGVREFIGSNGPSGERPDARGPRRVSYDLSLSAFASAASASRVRA